MIRTFEDLQEELPGVPVSVNFEPGQTIYLAPDVDAAVAFASVLAAEHGYDIFRGQRRAWMLNCSLFRSGVDAEDAIDRLAHLVGWIDQMPELVSLHGDRDAALAIAQHYGIPTWLIDFSRSPLIAGAFASTGPCGVAMGHEMRDEMGVILCGRRAEIVEAWSSDNEAQVAKGDGPLVRLIEIDVRNLWRLQAQAGLFLYSRIDPDWLTSDTPLVRIIVPRVEPPRSATTTIYPAEKSHLEVLLDQFFAIEWGWRKGRGVLQHVAEERGAVDAGHGKVLIGGNMIVDRRHFDGDPLAVPELRETGEGLAVGPTWTHERLSPWLDEPTELLADTVLGQKMNITVDCTAHVLEAVEASVLQILAQMAATPGSRGRSFSFDATATAPVDRSTTKDYMLEAFARRNEVAAYLWDGLRRLPVSDRQLAEALGRHLVAVMTVAHPDGWSAFKDMLGDLLTVDYEASGATGLGWVSERSVLAALCPEATQIVEDQPPGRRAYEARYRYVGCGVACAA